MFLYSSWKRSLLQISVSSICDFVSTNKILLNKNYSIHTCKHAWWCTLHGEEVCHYDPFITYITSIHQKCYAYTKLKYTKRANRHGKGVYVVTFINLNFWSFIVFFPLVFNIEVFHINFFSKIKPPPKKKIYSIRI